MNQLVLNLHDSIDIHDAAEIAAAAISEYYHTKEAESKKAEFHNMGWGTDGAGPRYSIASKTSMGVLTTSIDISDGRLRHEWQTI